MYIYIYIYIEMYISLSVAIWAQELLAAYDNVGKGFLGQRSPQGAPRSSKGAPPETNCSGMYVCQAIRRAMLETSSNHITPHIVPRHCV